MPAICDRTEAHEPESAIGVVVRSVNDMGAARQERFPAEAHEKAGRNARCAHPVDRSKSRSRRGFAAGCGCQRANPYSLGTRFFQH